ncbi:BnaA09g31150D [Brassica napus]|uniref:BnaA09g31150D protein n=1 Tax=Brassica napus TaxID=3708 RepID=A0A078I252_BRANA|nr:BnaA09g31150D [Brassica napus]
MRAVRLTCKHWEALSKSRSFSKMHIDKIRSGESLMIAKMGMGCNLYLVRIVLGGLNEDPFIDSIESPYSHRPAGWNWFTYALGYEDKGSTCRGYKLLSTWKRLDITPNSSRRLPYWGGVSLKGNTYWLASQRNTGQDLLDDHIICFDFTSESFGPLLPLPFYAGANDDVTIACVRDMD